MAHERRTQAYSVVFTKVRGILQIHGLPFPRARTLPFRSFCRPQIYREQKKAQWQSWFGWAMWFCQRNRWTSKDSMQNKSMELAFCSVRCRTMIILARPFESSKRALLAESTTRKFTELHANELNTTHRLRYIDFDRRELPLHGLCMKLAKL